jgi:hypothetical protein
MPKVQSIVVAVVSWVLLCAGGTGLAGCGAPTQGLAAGDDGGIDATSIDGNVLGLGPGKTSSDSGLSPDVFTGNGGCLALGSGCSGASECCSGDCANGACTYPACTSDQGACMANSDCCSQSCVGGTCAPLNPSCKTLGNACASDTDCCSQRCVGGTCQASSFCGQAGDACSIGTDCCAGACTKASGQSLGTCAPSAPPGPSNCGLVDGQLCGATPTDGGFVRDDAGQPTCGGPCCSRACAPWGPTGALICQPASGCHVVGDLCLQDGDCCGSAGLPGGSHSPVTCVIAAPGAVGVCRNPMGCKPDGDVCKLQTSSCNASCDCCSGNCETQDTCKQDNVGVPRCAAAQCVAAGGACASSANCCAGAPCVPNPVAGGTPPFVCAGTQCVTACGQCTNNADCCPGSSCVVGPGSTRGTCGPCGGVGGAPPDGGAGPGGDGGGDSGVCAQFGQLCQANSDCCNGVPCTSGRCEFEVF